MPKKVLHLKNIICSKWFSVVVALLIKMTLLAPLVLKKPMILKYFFFLILVFITKILKIRY